MKSRMSGLGAILILGCAGYASAQQANVYHMESGTPETFTRIMDGSLDQYGCIGSVAVEIPDIRFENDKAVLQPRAYRQMDVIAGAMQNFTHDHFVIEGHASAPGSDVHNMDLSHRRAETVLRAIMQRGVRENNISMRAYGERRLLYPAQPDHAYNRRVTVRRVGGNSAQVGAYRSTDQGRHAIDARIMLKGQNGVYAADPAVDIIKTGEPVYMCISASRAGQLYIEQQVKPSGPFKIVGSWVLQAEGLVRFPEPSQTFSFEGPAGREKIRLRHVDCQIASCGGSVMAKLESLRIDNRMRSKPVPAMPDNDIACEQPGVQCLTISVQHK